MAKIDFKTNTTKSVIEFAPDIIQPVTRGYLGMSGLGEECYRQVWYGFRFAEPKILPVKLKRIFERGDLEEKRIITDLTLHGMEVFRREGDIKIPLTGEIGEKQEELVGFAGHAKGHPDGRVLGVIEAPKTEHLLEIKTMNAKNFKLFQKDGVKLSHPKYYAQTQRYMDKMDLRRTLLIATNKDNEEREYERIYFDKEEAKRLEILEQDIIMSDQPLGERFSRSYYKCKWCNYFDICQNDKSPQVTCRSCEHADMEVGGKWVCGLNNDKELSLPDQLAACKSYRRLF